MFFQFTQKHYFVFTGLLCALLLAACAINPTADPTITLNKSTEAELIRSKLRHGDWLVVRGIHIPDNMVATLTNMPLSHAAIYDKEQDQVIESDSSGVHTSTLEAFLSRSQRVLIIEPIWADEQTRGPAVARARGWLGKGYNYTGLIGINTPDRFYCTQLVIDAYKPIIEKQSSDNPLPAVIKPGQMYHWGRIIYDSGPVHTQKPLTD